jgi:hypothetical protein
MEGNPVTKMAKIVRSRAKHFFGLSVGVRQKNNALILSMADKKTGEKAEETFELEDDLKDLFYYEDAPYDYADDLINKFVYPVRPLV